MNRRVGAATNIGIGMVMRRMHIVFLALSLTVSAATLSAQRGAPDPERAAVQQIIVAIATHIQAGKLGAIDSLFSERGHILTDTTTLHSWAEYRDGQLKAELARYANLRFEHTSVEAVVRGTVAWVAFRQLLSGTVANVASQVSGRGTAVLEKRDGRWLIVHLHVSR